MLELSTRFGCQLKNTTKFGLSYVCSGRRPFTPGPAGPAAGSERQILVAIYNCRVEQLVTRYRIEMYGFVCNSGTSWSIALPTLKSPIVSAVRAVINIAFARPLVCLGGFVAFASSINPMMPS